MNEATDFDMAAVARKATEATHYNGHEALVSWTGRYRTEGDGFTIIQMRVTYKGGTTLHTWELLDDWL